MSLGARIVLLTVWSLFQPLSAGETADVLAPYRLKEWEGDGRLARHVSLSVWGSPLTEAIRQLSQRSGVSLRVSREVAQWRAVIYVQETPLSDLLAGIAFTFDLAWRRLPVKEGDPPAYELYQTPAQRRAQQEFLPARVALAQRIVGEALRRAAWMATQGVRPPTPTRKEPPRSQEEVVQDCTFWLMHDPRLQVVLGKLSPPEWSQLFAGERVVLPPARFSPQEAQTVSAPPPPLPREWLAEDAPPEVPQEVGERQLVGVELTYDPLQNTIQAFISHLRLDRDRALTLEGASLSWQDLAHPPVSTEEAFTVGNLLTSDELRRQTAPPSAHLLETVAERLHRLSTAVPIGVIAEYYPLSMDPELQLAGGGTVQELLQPLMWQYRPRRSANLLLFPAVSGASRYWHRLCDIPEALLVRWLGDDQRFGFSLQALSEMQAQLSPYQKQALSRWSMFATRYYATRSPARAVTLHQFYLGHSGAAELLHLFLRLPEWRTALTGQRLALDPARPEVAAFLDRLPTWTSYLQELPPDAPDTVPWLRVERQVDARWAYDAPLRRGELAVLQVEDLCLSKPNEELRAFQARLRQERQVEEGRWLRVERERMTLRFGLGDREVATFPFELTRFTRRR